MGGLTGALVLPPGTRLQEGEAESGPSRGRALGSVGVKPHGEHNQNFGASGSLGRA